MVRAGVVSGSFFPVMGLQPIRGRLIDATDDGARQPSVTVLTHRFWTESLNSDETVLGKQIKLGDRASTIIGVLEPSVPYPAETQLIANVVTSSHHMSATMQDGRVHRMTELFGRLAPGRGPRAGARRAARDPWRHADRAQGSVSGEATTSGSTRCSCAIRSRRRRARCCWCCWRRRG